MDKKLLGIAHNLISMSKIGEKSGIYKELATLSYKEVCMIEALMLSGRDEISYKSAYETIELLYTPDSEDEEQKELAIGYIMGKAWLHDYIENGIKRNNFE